VDRILELLARLASDGLSAEEMTELTGLCETALPDATDEQLAAYEAAVLAAADRFREPEGGHTRETAATLGVLADIAERHRAEVARRAEQSAEATRAAEEALARITAHQPEVPQDPPPGEERPPQEAPPVVPAPPNPDPDPQRLVPPDETGEGEPRAVAAAARPSLARVASARPRAAAPAPPAAAPLRPSEIVAAPGGRVAPGTVLTSPLDVADVIIDGLDRGAEGRDERVARVVRHAPEDRVMRAGDEAGNTRRLDAVLAAAQLPPVEQQALVAAGGLCAPLPTLYDVNVLGAVDRPLLAMLPTVSAADRGGFQWRSNITPSSLAGSIGTWTLQNDIDAIAGTPTKPVLEIGCPGTQTVTIQATTQRLRFTNINARYDREGVAANVRAGEIVYAQTHELAVLAKMDPVLVQVTSARKLGASRDILALLDHATAYFRNRHRLPDAQRLVVVCPRWVRDLFRMDIMRGIPGGDLGPQLAAADATIAGWFAARNVDPTFLWDHPALVAAAAPRVAQAAQGFAAATQGGAIPGFPDQALFRIFMAGDFVYVDGGELDLGVVRDSALNAINRYETFYEEFWNVAWRGVEGWLVVADVQPTGESVGTVSGAAFAD
jgi:hypothetical protein